jgi:hypothetical protein
MNNIKKYGLLILAFLFIATISFAQTAETRETESKDDGESILNKLVIGGNVGAGYANGWNINLSPTIGYKLTNSTVVGVGITYNYADFNNPFYNNNRTTYNTTGGRVFVQQLLFQNLYAHVEYEYLSYEVRVRSNDGRVVSQFEATAPGLLLGGGYSSSFGNGLGFTTEILYNVLYRSDISPYASPLIFRGGLMYGF